MGYNNCAIISAMTRRLILILLLISLVACSGPQPTSIPPTDIPPTATRIPPSPDDTAKVFLSAWQQADYATMYQQLAPNARLQVSDTDLADLYRKAQTEAAVINVRAQVRSSVRQRGAAQITFHEEWDTPLFGTLQADNVMTLTLSENRWGIEWDAGLIWPGLAGGNLLRMTWAIPARANIYDRDGLGLAYEGTNVTLGVVPQQITDEGGTAASASAR